MSENIHAMTDYLIAIGLHLNGELPLEEVEAYCGRVVPNDPPYASQYSTAILLAGLRSGTLEPWEPIFKAKAKLTERWAGFWAEREQPRPYLASLFFARFQGRSPLFMDPADMLIFLKIRDGRVENLEELERYFLAIEGPRIPDGVFAIQTIDLARAIRKRRKL